MHIRNKTFKDLFLLIVVTIVAYWPVSFFIFSLKNDSLVQYLPFRYHLSEAIQHGQFPFWNPYLYTGFPIHADMQGEVWNPFVLLISFFTRYNMSVLQFEVIIYLCLCAIGMYTLLSTLGFRRIIAVLAGISYMCCGYITDSASVIPWIASASFLPFTYACLFKLLINSDFKNSLLFSFSLTFLFLCGYPSLFIYNTYIILLIIVFSFFRKIKEYNSRQIRKTLFYLLTAALIFLLLCAPAIISYWEFLPYYSRGSGISLKQATDNPLYIFSTLSYLLPNAVSKPHTWIVTDISARNSYTGMFFLLLFLVSFFNKYNPNQKLILCIIIFSFLFSLGSLTPLHEWCYRFLPFMNTFRHPATIRIFTSIGIILLASYGLRSYFANDPLRFKNLLKKASYLFGIVLLFFAIYYFVTGNVFQNISSAIPNAGNAKALLDKISFASMASIQAVMQLFFLVSFMLLLHRNKTKISLAVLVALNSIVFTWMALPFTFISQVKTKTINDYLQTFPTGYPPPHVSAPIEANIVSDSTFISSFGYPNFYTKKITIQDHIITPTINEDYAAFLNNKRLREITAHYPWVYAADTVIQSSLSIPDIFTNKKIAIIENKERHHEINSTATNMVALKKFSVNHFVFEVISNDKTFLVLTQQYNHNWKVKVNDILTPVYKTNIAFMGVSLPGGKMKVEFLYRPKNVIKGMAAALITILFVLFYLIFTLKKSRVK